MENVRPIDANSIHYTRVLAQKGLDMELAAKSSIESMPTLDYEPVRHAHWIENQDGGVCSDCRNGLKVYKKIRPMIVFCPFCGDKMDGGK